MANLDEILKQLANPAPKYEDPEEDEGDVTRATLTARETGAATDDIEVGVSQLRRQTAADTFDDDARYKGKKTSRTDMFDFTGEAEDEDDEDEEIDSDEADGYDENEEKEDVEQEGEEDGDDESMEEQQDADDVEEESGDEAGGDESDEEIPFDEAGSDEEEQMADDVEEKSGDEASGDESDEEIPSDEAGSDEEEQMEESEGVRQFSAVNIEDEVAKGKAVVAQLDLWDHLMEGRIKLQKVLASVNSLPKPERLQQLKAENPELLAETHTKLQMLLAGLLQLQAKLLHANPETKGVAKGSGSSDSSPRKRSHETEEDDGEAVSAKRFAGFQAYRNDTLRKWDENTRLGSKLKSFSTFNTSVLKQIDQIMSDKDRLVKRTQINRSKAADSKVEATHDPEVFNDDDFYHMLLKELIERKSDASDPTDVTRQWLEIQKMRNSVKKKTVDTRASKGRKLRYNIHKKMVNFMAPVDMSTWSTEAKNDLFKSLFKGTSAVEV